MQTARQITAIVLMLAVATMPARMAMAHLHGGQAGAAAHAHMLDSLDPERPAAVRPHCAKAHDMDTGAPGSDAAGGLMALMVKGAHCQCQGHCKCKCNSHGITAAIPSSLFSTPVEHAVGHTGVRLSTSDVLLPIITPPPRS